MLDSGDKVIERFEDETVPIHCIFRGEMEHLVRRAGYEIEAVYGDFTGRDLDDESEEMIWVLKRI